MKIAWCIAQCLLSGVLLTATFSGCALLQLPFQALGALTSLAGTWKDDQSRVCVIQPDGAFELRDRQGRQEFRGHCIVNGERIVIVNARAAVKNNLAASSPDSAATYRFELRRNRLALHEMKADDNQKAILLLSLSAWQRQ
jgi:hypothetical protein